MAQRTDSPEQQTLHAIYDAALFYSEKHAISNLACCDFLDQTFEERQAVLDAWDRAGRPAPETEELMDFIRRYFHPTT